MEAACAPLSSPRPPASTPTSRTGSSTNGAKIPMALLPPPTHATTAVGNRPVSVSICARAARRSDHVMRRPNVGHPVADRLVGRVLERLAAAVDRRHRRPQQLHLV